MIDSILAGKKVLYIAPADSAVDLFTMPDNRLVCPRFDRLKLASNGCFYRCDWCYLKLTYQGGLSIHNGQDRLRNYQETNHRPSQEGNEAGRSFSSILGFFPFLRDKSSHKIIHKYSK